ncbi:cytochrome o ubiquinol oxidase subunit III [Methyloligella sp. 2.7D]|uniref:cytochrome o ubiquinol oxidase subunit III n=1 Tax=unclassified Methyloligella TaxID=2625955 RepID=UPI00157D68B0|nr:cytochrome o ubiquinol oxidase subunit III [Methyloligella sp. GL2]QKP76698.1 cytochrome o ubiquinol oxidase subunit III [Methyloligella sp. GL2]
MSAVAANFTETPIPPDEARGYEEKAFGFWVYLMSDAVIFALLFATYVVMVGNTAGGPDGATLFSLTRASGETALLLTSSITFGIATVEAARGRRDMVLIWLLVTAALGLGFLFLEFGEFSSMISEGAGPQRSGFLSSFFTLVGTHGLHVSLGLFWLFVMVGQIVTKGLTAPVASRLMRLGLFWHFLDIIWVAIFSIVYLPGLL